MIKTKIRPRCPTERASLGHGSGEALRIQSEIQTEVKPRRCGPDALSFVFHTWPDLPLVVGWENEVTFAGSVVTPQNRIARLSRNRKDIEWASVGSLSIQAVDVTVDQTSLSQVTEASSSNGDRTLECRQPEFIRFERNGDSGEFEVSDASASAVFQVGAIRGADDLLAESDSFHVSFTLTTQAAGDLHRLHSCGWPSMQICEQCTSPITSAIGWKNSLN